MAIIRCTDCISNLKNVPSKAQDYIVPLCPRFIKRRRLCSALNLLSDRVLLQLLS